ncbi:MAG: hypothetical protein AAF682_32425 [Planctomycetota bacterium]
MNALTLVSGSVVAGLALVLPVVSTPQELSSPPIRVTGSGESECHEDVEILRRLLADALEHPAAPVDGTVPPTWRVTSTEVIELKFLQSIDPRIKGDSMVRHSRGFYVPGLGAVLTLDLALPVIPVVDATVESEGTAPPEDDAWSRVEREVRGEDDPLDPAMEWARVSARADSFLWNVVQAGDVEWKLSEEARTNAEDTVVKLLARHASRLGLADGESLTVLLHISGAQRTVDTSLFGDTVTDPWAPLLEQSSQRSVGEVQTSIRMPAELLKGHRQQPLPEADLRRRILVHRTALGS